MLRAVVGVAAVWVLWIPLAEPTLAVVARAAESVLAWMSPPLITSLEVSGDTVDIRGLLYHPNQWMGRWAAGNLPIFIIASLGLAVAVPVRDWADRASLVGGTLLVCFLAMVAVTVVEVLVVGLNWAAGREDLLLVSEAERRAIGTAHETVGLMQMLLPATLALVAYGLQWADEEEPGPGSWKVPVAIWSTLLVVVVVLMLPAPSPGSTALARFARTAELNPEAPKPWLAYAQAATRVGSPAAVPAFGRARANGADARAVRIGVPRALLASGQARDALVAAEEALRTGPKNPALLQVESTALVQLGRPCEAKGRLETALVGRPGRPALLVQALEMAAAACAEGEGL